MREELANRYSVRRIGVFGSFARGEENAESDVDIVVDLASPTFDNFMDLAFLLEDKFQRHVDLVLTESVKPMLKPIIAREVIYA